MRFRPGFFRNYAAAPTGDLAAVTTGQAGADGFGWQSAWMAGGPDVNPQLSGARKFQVYDEMQKTDPSVKSVLHFLGLPVRSARWSLEPADDSPQAAVVRDMVAWNLGLEGEDGQLDLSWDELCQQALKMLVFGAQIEELIWDDVQTWRDADGDPHLVRPLKRVAPRQATTIIRVNFQDGQIVEVQQNLPGTRPIPGDKISYLCWEREGGRWEGVSLLRPAWGAWFAKKNLIVAHGIGADRWATGIPIIYHPDNEDAEQKAKQMGRNLRQHERAYGHLPGPRDPSNPWAIEMLEGNVMQVDAMLRFYSEQIAEAGLQQFTRQGLGQTGARATAEVQSDPYFLAVEALAAMVARERRRQIIRKLVGVNFGQDAVDRLMPKLTVSRIQAKSLEKMATAIADLAQAGIYFTDRGAVDDLREQLSFPELPELPEDIGLAQLQPPPQEGDGLAGTPALPAPTPRPQLPAAAR